jgi:arylsulfatase A-like enzyme
MTMRQNLKTAALVGMLAGVVIGIVEAAMAIAGARRLSPADTAALFAITAGLYGTLGWFALGILGLIIGAAATIVRRGKAADLRLFFYIIGAAAVPAALILGRPSDQPFQVIRAVVAALIVGGIALGVTRIARRARKHLVAAQARARRRWLLLLWPIPFAVFVALIGWRIAFPGPRADAPPILLITVDALRADRLGCDGNTQGLTPNLDRFARDGVVFEKTFASAPWTEASVGAFFTSLFPSELGLVVRTRSEDEVHFEGGVFTPQPTLTELLRANGYLTAAEITNPQLRRDRGFARGFIRFRNPDDFFTTSALALPRLGNYENWFLHTSIGIRLALALRRAPRFYTAPKLSKDDAERLVHDASAWLERQDAGPFFLWMHLMDVHVPYRLSARSAATAAAFPNPPFEPTPQFCKDLVRRQLRLTDQGRRYMHALYDDEVRHTDLWLGRLFDHLRRLKIYDNALIIVSADHGEEFWDHGGFEHGRTMYEEVLQVPLVIKFPRGQHAGTRVPQQVRLIDLLPTVLDAARLPVPRGIRGSALTRLLGAAHPRDDRELYAESTLYGEELKALRVPAYKVIFHTGTRATEVYDLRADPRERRNLAGEKAVAPDLRERLMRLVRDSKRRTEWWAKYGEKAPPLDQRSLEQLRSVGYMAK